MNAISKFLNDENTAIAFLQDEEGATAIEYGLLAALIGCAIIVGATALGGGLNDLFDRIADILDAAVPAAG